MLPVSAPFVAGPDANASRQRHAPLYGRLVAEEHLPAAHRDAVHQVSFLFVSRPKKTYASYVPYSFRRSFTKIILNKDSIKCGIEEKANLSID